MEQHHSSSEREWSRFDRDGTEVKASKRARQLQSCYWEWHCGMPTSPLLWSCHWDVEASWLSWAGRLLQGRKNSQETNQNSKAPWKRETQPWKPIKAIPTLRGSDQAPWEGDDDATAEALKPAPVFASCAQEGIRSDWDALRKRLEWDGKPL